MALVNGRSFFPVWIVLERSSAKEIPPEPVVLALA
jgi:hypothetical protein